RPPDRDRQTVAGASERRPPRGDRGGDPGRAARGGGARRAPPRARGGGGRQAARPAAGERALRLEADVEGAPLPAFILGDATRLQQVLGNLIANAIKFTPEGGEIRVALRQEDARAEVSISDSGQGISAEALPRIFERFRQSEAPASRRRGGLGLGLAVSKQLVELHGGTVSARSP